MRQSKLRLAWYAFTVLLIAVGACILVMRAEAPLSVWMIGPRDVAAELAQRAADGDPVEAERLQWPAARPGVSWRDLGPEPPDTRALYLNPQEFEDTVISLAVGLRQVGYVNAETLEWLDRVESAELLELEELELGERWDALEWMQRDPARWLAADERDLLDREMRAMAMAFSVGDPCELAVPAWIDVFHADAARAITGTDQANQPPPLSWLSAYADYYSAELDSAALRGDGGGAVQAARRLRCLIRACDAPINLLRGLIAVRIEEQGLRQIEAALPLLAIEDQRALLELLLFDVVTDHDRQFLRALRAERAYLHWSYARFSETGAKGANLFAGMRFGRPLHGEFLACLRDYYEVQAALEQPDYRTIELALNDLDNATRNGLRGKLSEMSIPPLARNYVRFVEHNALQRCARVAAVRVIDGVEAAEALAVLLVDPFDGQPLRTRLRDDGVFEVWSVGRDRIDHNIVFRVPR